MIGTAPSQIAERVAMHRAAHQIFDNPRVFEDPLAIAIVGENAAHLRSQVDALDTASARYLRALVAARSRYADDELAAAVRRGAVQYVIIGAGLDTYAYRTANSQTRIFEVDRPAAQAWKRYRLETARIAVPGSLIFAPTNFEEQTLSSALESSGFRLDKISFFSWLGVTSYLTASSTLETLAFIGSLPKGSGVVFDYAPVRSALNSVEQMAMDSLASRVARAGEASSLFLDSRALVRTLGSAGFNVVEDLGPAEIDARYFAHRGDRLSVGAGPAHLVLARV